MDLPSGYSYRAGRLYCEDVPVSRIADDVGTPVYVYSAGAIRDAFREIRSLLPDFSICYAVKANSNLSVLRLLSDEGSFFDIVSRGELHRLERVGVSSDRIVFSGAGKTDAELEAAVSRGLLALQVESLEELRRVAALAERGGKRVRVALRCNPDIATETHPYISTGLRRHKFGIDIEALEPVVDFAASSDHLQVVGLGSHIGSQIHSPEPYLGALRRLREIADGMRLRGLAIEHIDIGGGFGVSYQEGSTLDMASLAQSLRRESGGYRIMIEPGRLLVARAGILLNRVLEHKISGEVHFVIVDGAMNDLIRPALYQAFHPIAAESEQSETMVADVVGPVCETGDFFARKRQIPRMRAGDLLAVLHAGAYGFTLSSNYNSRPRSAEVLVDGNGFRVARRRETLDDLIRSEEF